MLPLQLRHDATLDSEPDAWFLRGNSSARWLDELARCGLAEVDTRLFVVPKSVDVRAPAGLLVVPANPHSIVPHPSGLACRMIADRLIVPVDAVLQPPVTDAEVQALCPLPVSFYHPAFGLSSYETEATLRVWDLLEVPGERTEAWNFAQAGAPALPELRTITVAQPPSIDDLFGGAQEEIGSEPPLDLPPAPDEPKENALAKSRQALQRFLAKNVAAAMSKIPHTGNRRTWANALEDWANRKLNGLNQQLDRIRHKELHRLLHLFDKDPEAALRHAIPMNAFAHRGVAPPTGRLGAHSLNFDLSRLGGRAADFWEIPPDVQEQLRRRYREMADREMQLGRHRRAAYIYAELLGDLVSAANALKQGKHFREAALLYDEHLKNPLEAAQCLAAGGLFAEAIERYEKLGRWLEVADLHERLGNTAAAHAAIRRVVDERIGQDDITGAAKLVDERMHQPDEALNLLLGAWPASRQAASCVGAAFQMLARLGRPDQALELIGRFPRDTAPAMVLPLLQALSVPARSYPDARVQHRAADLSRVLVGRQLGRTQVPGDEASRLVEFLVRLAPQDRLLARDANRHLASRRESELRARRVTPPPLPGNKPVIVRRFELPRQMEWLQLRSKLHWFFAVGVTPKRLTLIRGIWEGEQQSLAWDCPAEAVRSGLVCEPRGTTVALKTASGHAFTMKHFPAADLFFDTACIAWTPAWVKPQHWPVAFGDDSVWTAHVAAGRGIISCHDHGGKLQRTIDVTDYLLNHAERTEQTRLCLVAIGNNVAIALGNRLVLTRSAGDLLSIELPGQVIGLVATLPHTRAGVAVMLEHGAVMHWLGAPGLIELERDIPSPQGAFVHGGPLVLISETRLVLLDVDTRGVQKVTRVELTGQRPVGVSATASPGEFALMGARGEMTVYRISP